VVLYKPEVTPVAAVPDLNSAVGAPKVITLKKPKTNIPMPHTVADQPLLLDPLMEKASESN
jgi:hypothetical protein